MSCKICDRNSCTESFHSLEEQSEFSDKFQVYEDRISVLKDKIIKLNFNEKLLWDILTREQKNEIESKLL